MKKFFLQDFKIGLDLDEVIADFLGGYEAWTGNKCVGAKNFYFSYKSDAIIKSLPDEFWATLKPKIRPEDLNFLPTYYISRRSFSEQITEDWLEKHKFPCMPVLHVKEKSKIETVKKSGIEYYLDDYIFNFQQLNGAGVTTFLMDCSHNQQFDVGDYRINHISDLPDAIYRHKTLGGWLP